MGPYDLAMKRLSSEFTDDYVRFALNRTPSYAEVLEVQEVDGRGLPPANPYGTGRG